MFVSEDSRENGQNRRRSTDVTQIVAHSKAPMAVSGGIFAPEGHGGMPEAPAGGTRRGVSLSAILRYKWTVFLITVLVAAPAITGVWMLVVPEYSARAEIRVRPIVHDILGQPHMIPLYKSFMNTQVSILRSPTVLQRVLDHKSVQQTKWYKNPRKSLIKGQTPPPMERLRDILSASPRRGTELIDISFKAPSPKEAEAIVNATLDQYVSYISDIADSTSDDIYNQLSERYKSQGKEIDGLETILLKRRAELGTGVPEELVAMKRVSLEGIEGKYRAVYLDMSVAQWRQKRLEKVIAKIKAETKKRIEDEKKKGSGDKAAPAGVPATQPADVQPQYRQDAYWRGLDMQVRTLKHQIESAGKDFKPGHPTMVKLAGELKFTEAMLARRQAELDEDWKNRSKPVSPAQIALPGQPTIDPQKPEAAYELKLQIVTAELELLKHQADLLLVEVEKQRVAFAATFQNAQKLETENEALRHKRRQFEIYRDRLYQMDLKRKAPGSISILTRAVISSKPSNDRRIVFTAMSLVAGLGLGLGLGFLRASRNQAIYAPDDLPSHAIEGPFLGQLPIVTKTKGTAVEDNPLLVEGIRMVRTALISRIREDRGSAILVSSAHTGAGKSTFAVMLARSLALSGKKILLIDSDLRKRDLTGRFNLVDEPGFIESLRHRCLDDRSVFSTETPDLNFMPSGQRNGGVELELTANGAFGALIDQARGRYDVIILDSPPILPVADASILSRQVDGTVLVVRQETCHRAAVVDALASLGSAGGKLLGTVFLASQQKALYGSAYYSYGDTH